jgi:hypothetical protein
MDVEGRNRQYIAGLGCMMLKKRVFELYRQYIDDFDRRRIPMKVLTTLYIQVCTNHKQHPIFQVSNRQFLYRHYRAARPNSC